MFGSTFRLLGNLAIIAGLGILLFTFGPLAVQEVTYRARPDGFFELADGPKNELFNINPEKILTPINTNFSLIIPKIGANSAVIANVDPGNVKEYQIANVDPNNAREYQSALSKGVAHAFGSALPNENGNVFLFAHSAGNFLQASKYNAVFYLLNKLEAEDQIFLYYQNHKYEYKVTQKSIVTPQESTSLLAGSGKNTLVLMTCWPPGTTYKRVLVYAQKVPDKN